MGSKISTSPEIGIVGETSNFDRLGPLIGWLIDTNVVAELIRPRCAPQVMAWVTAQTETTLHLSILTIAEYDKGIANLPEHDHRTVSYSNKRDQVSARFEGRTLPVSNAIVRRWGQISGRVRRDTGHSPEVVDTLLAATALEHDLYLVTRNTRDVQNTGAALFNPWESDPRDFPIIARPRRRRIIDVA